MVDASTLRAQQSWDLSSDCQYPTFVAALQLPPGNVLEDLEYRSSAAGDPEGVAFIHLPSGRWIEVRNAEGSGRPGLFGLSMVREGDDGDELVGEFLKLAGLRREDIR